MNRSSAPRYGRGRLGMAHAFDGGFGAGGFDRCPKGLADRLLRSAARLLSWARLFFSSSMDAVDFVVRIFQMVI